MFNLARLSSSPSGKIRPDLTLKHPSARKPAADGCGLLDEARFCGNLVCEEKHHETAQNCPIDCSNASVRSYNSQIVCEEPAAIHSPSNAAEVQAILRDPTLLGYSVRIVGAKHSQTSLFCTRDLLLSTRNLTKIRGLREANGETVVDVEPGVTLGQLQDWLHERNYSLGFAVPNYPHITVAGAVSTASHGSSRVHPASFASILRTVELVTASGELLTYDSAKSPAPDWDAVRVTLGSLGVVTRLGFKVEPQFKVNVTTTKIADKHILGAYPEGWPAPCDSETYFWFPGSGSALRFCGRTVPGNEEGDGVNTILLQKAPQSSSEEALRQILHLATCSSGIACVAEKAVLESFWIAPPFKRRTERGKLVSSRSVTGYSHRMLTSHFPDANQRFYSIIDWSLTIPPANVRGALGYFESFVKRNRIHFPVGGVTLRFVRDDGTTLGPSHFAATPDPAPAVVLEFVTYDPQRLEAATREKLEGGVARLVQDLITLYGARPHWGKNRDWVIEAGIRAGNYGDQIRKFLALKSKLDPFDRFGNDFTRRIFQAHAADHPGAGD